MASRKLCYTKTGLKKSPKANGRCPQGSNRSRRNKDAGTGRTGGYAAKRISRGARKGKCATRGKSVEIDGYSVKRKLKSGKFTKKYSVGPYCRKKPAKRGKGSRARRY